MKFYVNFTCYSDDKKWSDHYNNVTQISLDNDGYLNVYVKGVRLPYSYSPELKPIITQRKPLRGYHQINEIWGV